jgi:hypothetical protein
MHVNNSAPPLPGIDSAILGNQLVRWKTTYGSEFRSPAYPEATFFMGDAKAVCRPTAAGSRVPLAAPRSVEWEVMATLPAVSPIEPRPPLPRRERRRVVLFEKPPLPPATPNGSGL